MGLEAAVQLAGHLLDKHAWVAELDGAQHGSYDSSVRIPLRPTKFGELGIE